VKCPACNGSGNGGRVHVNTGMNMATGRCSGYWKEESNCFRCDGSGDVPDSAPDWIAKGKQLRAERIMRGELLHDAAKRMGISTSELSAIEMGKKCLDQVKAGDL